jgi:hypothetical protein
VTYDGLQKESDIATAVFSCATNTDLAHVHVHWCQEKQNETGIGQKEYGEM